MNNMIDWHIHSNASDGFYTPEDLVDIIKKSDINAAITDHDTVQGVKIAMENGGEGVLVPGIELSTFDGGTKVHLLGYHIDYKDGSLENELKPIQEKRRKRSEELLEKAHKRNLWENVSYDEIKEKNPSSVYISSVHIATELAHKGYYKSVVEAQENVNRESLYEQDAEPFAPYLRDGLNLLKKYGKIVSLAHLNELKKEDFEEARFVSWMKDVGLDAMEAISSKYNPEQIVRYIGFAKRFDLKITVGSDFHWKESTPKVKMGIELDSTLNEDILKALIMSREEVYELLVVL